MINNNKKDRRIEKTEYVLVNSLAALMHSKNIKDISVKELCEYANVNRGTFYLHYNDIYDMLDTIWKTFFLNMIISMPKTSHIRFFMIYSS